MLSAGPRIEELTCLRAGRNLSGSAEPLLDLSPYLARTGAKSCGYGPHSGARPLRSAVADICGVAPEHILITAGATFALALVAITLSRQGHDAVLVRPCYPPAKDLLLTLGVRVVEHRVSFDDGYVLDPKAIAGKLSARVRLVSVASPHNPSGISMSQQEIGDLAALVGKMPAAVLLVDETFREAVSRAECIQPCSAALGPPVVAVGSLSKAYGVPGLRIGWVASQDVALLQALTQLQADLLHSVSLLDQAIATDLLADRKRLIKANAALLRERLHIVRAWSEANVDLIDWLPPNAGAITCFRLRDGRFAAAARRRLASTLSALDLALAPGPAFGDEDAVYRIALGYGSSSEFASALEDLGRGLRACAFHCDACL